MEDISKVLPFNKYMVFTKNLINQMKVSKQVKGDLKAKYEEIFKRANDVELKLALIGQFSSGKSTFINALLGKEVLKVAWKATTVIPTFIRCHERTFFVVCFRNGKKIKVLENDTFELYSIMKIWGCEVENDQFIYLLQKVTSDSHSLKYVDRVEFFYPKETIGYKLCLIDTPGVNPGDEDTSEHRSITKSILKKDADAAIILFPATRVFTNDFEDFLMDNVANIMHRCAFVVTMMDLVEEDEREEIIEFMKKMLITKFHIQNPQVFYCAARYATSNDMEDNKIKYWNDIFYKMRDDLTKYIIDQRVIVIAEELTELLKVLLKEAENALNVQRSELKMVEKNLTENSIEKLEDVLFILKDECYKNNIEQYKNKEKFIENEGYKFQCDVNKAISQLLKNGNFDTFGSIISKELPLKIKKSQLLYNEAIDKSLRDLIQDGENEIIKFKREFEGFYKNLKAIDNYTNTNLYYIDIPKTESISFTNFKNSMKKEDDKDKKNAKYGAGGGAAAGFLVGGPIGALIGAGIGAVSTVIYSASKLEEYKEELEESIESDVQDFVNQCKKESSKTLEFVKNKINYSIIEIVNSHKKAYELAINSMIEEHNENLKNIKNEMILLNQMQTSVENTIYELEFIQKKIKEL